MVKQSAQRHMGSSLEPRAGRRGSPHSTGRTQPLHDIVKDAKSPSFASRGAAPLPRTLLGLAPQTPVLQVVR